MRCPSLLAVLVLSASLAAPLAGQDTSPEAFKKVDALFEAWDAFGQPGMAVGIILDGELVYGKGFGMANLEVDLPNGPDVIYRIGSTSKQFTAASVSLLALDGKIDFEAPITKYFPEFSQHEPPVLVRHLVHHISGIPDYIGIQFRSGGGSKAWFTPAQSLKVLTTAELEFTPGSKFSYSNSNYLMLAELVRRTSGMNLREFAQARIFGPLGMHMTHFQDRHDEVVFGRSHGYSRQDEKDRGEWKVDITHLDHVGDGGVFTTVEDLVKWDANFYDNQLGHGQEFLDLMHTRGVLNNGETIPYARGLGLKLHRGLPTVSHGGAWVGYLAEMVRFPEQRFSVIVLANQTSVSPTTLARKVSDICLEELYTK